MPEDSEEQTTLTSERFVEAATVQVQRLDEIIDRGGLVATVDEDAGSGLEDGLLAEASWSTHVHHGSHKRTLGQERAFFYRLGRRAQPFCRRSQLAPARRARRRQLAASPGGRGAQRL